MLLASRHNQKAKLYLVEYSKVAGNPTPVRTTTFLKDIYVTVVNQKNDSNFTLEFVTRYNKDIQRQNSTRYMILFDNIEYDVTELTFQGMRGKDEIVFSTRSYQKNK